MSRPIWEEPFPPGEVLLWHGRPQLMSRIQPPYLFVPLLATAGLGFAVNVLWQNGFQGIVPTLLCLGFVAVMLPPFYGAVILPPRARVTSTYAFTNRRARRRMLGLLGWEDQEWPLTPDSPIDVPRDLPTSVVFHAETLHFDEGDEVLRDGFLNIRDADHVAAMARTAQADLTKGTFA